MKKLLLTSCIFLAACSQDPLSKYPDEIRKNAIPPNEKVKEDRPKVPRDGLIIEMTPGIVNLVEGEETEIQFKGRLVGSQAGDSFELSMEEIPVGGSFDPSSGIFKWTPPTNFVSGISPWAPYVLKLTMTTNTTPVIMANQEFSVNVYRNISQPEIISVETIGEMSEGDEKTIEVRIRDNDAMDGSINELKKPTLTIIPSQNGSRSAASWISIKKVRSWESNPVQDVNDPSVWIFKLDVDLSDVEITHNRAKLEFGIRANSPLGIPSQVKLSTFQVKTNVSDVKVTWDDSNYDMLIGERYNFFFEVYSERPDGKIAVEFSPQCQTFPGKTSCKCEPVNRFTSNALQCEFRWTPGGTLKDQYDITIKAFNKGLLNNGLKTATVTNTFRVFKPNAKNKNSASIGQQGVEQK